MNSTIFNITGNGSGNGSEVPFVWPEFPYWKSTVVLTYILNLGFLIFPPLLLNLSLFVALVFNKAIRKQPLSIIHGSELLVVGLNRVFIGIIAANFLPPAIRFCQCSELINLVWFFFQAFILVYSPIIFAILGILQLLVILGKKKFVTRLSVAILVGICAAYSIVFSSSCLGYLITSNTRTTCSKLCGTTSSETLTNYNVFFLSYGVMVLLPCLAIVIVASTWSCIVFKKSYIGGDSQLSRRLVSLPLIIPLSVISITLLVYLLRDIGVRILLISSVGIFFPQWAIFASGLISFSEELAGGLFYPLVLMFIHPQLRRAWVKMFKSGWSLMKGVKNRKRIRVAPTTLLRQDRGMQRRTQKTTLNTADIDKQVEPSDSTVHA